MQHKNAKVGRMWALLGVVSGGVAACGALMSGCGGGGHGGTGAAQPMLGVNGRVAFSRFERLNGGYQVSVYTSNPDGSDQRLLARNVDSPTWSLDGQQLAVFRNGEITILRADGSEVRHFPVAATAYGGPLVWSPRGDRIALNTFGDNRTSIATVRTDGTDFRVLTTDARNASWSPDGKRLTFYSTGTERVYPFEICVINADGTGKKCVLRRPATDVNPVWSPDGRRILFESAVSDSAMQLLSIRPDGSDLRQLDTIRAGFQSASTPVYSPDATKVIFIGYNGSTGTHIYIINTDGTGLTPTSLDDVTSIDWGTNPITAPPFPTPGPTVNPTPGFTNPPPF